MYKQPCVLPSADSNNSQSVGRQDGTLPLALADLGSPVPLLIDDATVANERPTYYWYLRLIWNLYRCVSNERS